MFLPPRIYLRGKGILYLLQAQATRFYLATAHQKKLAALSLWAHVKIVYSEESDFGWLSKSNMITLTENEICEVKTYDEEKSLDLTDKVGFNLWSKVFHCSLYHMN